MPENSADEDRNTPDRNREAGVWLKRFGRRVKKELTLVGKCARSASPDRSSAGVLFLVLFAFSLTCVLSRYLVGSQTDRFPTYAVPLLIVGYEVAGVVCLTLIWRFAQPCRDCNTDADQLQPWHRLIRDNIKLFGIVLFYFAIFVFDLFRWIAELQCVDAWMACASGDVRAEHVADLVYPLARGIYLFVELIVCVRFNEVDFYQNTPVLAGLAVVQATNLSGWLDALVNESDVFASYRNATYELSRCFNATDDVNASVSEHFVRCFRHTTGEFELLESASPYLYPFIVEYLMLVMECVADWFFSDAYRHHHGTTPSRPEHVAAAATTADDEGGTELRSVASVEATSDERRPLQEPDAAASRASTSDSAVQSVDDRCPDDDVRLIDVERRTSTTSTERCPQPWCRWLGLDRCPPVLFSVILPLIASFLFVIFGIYSFSLGQIGYRDVFMYYRIGFWVWLSLAALAGYAVSREFPSGPMNPNGFEYFVILSCIGPILQSIFTIVANVQTDAVPMGIFLAEEVTNIVHICVQVMFYAYAKSIRIRTAGGGDDENRFAARCKLSTLRIVISSFALCNFALWVEDSFIETRNSEKSWQKQYYNNWPVIYNIFNPLALVFRFSSVLLFLNVFFEKGR